SAQVGTGERAEKIRTYNYPERRVTDHRIGLRLHNLDGILIGELDELTGALREATSVLSSAGVDTPRLDAELLLAFVLGVDRARLVVDAHASVSEDHL